MIEGSIRTRTFRWSANHAGELGALLIASLWFAYLGYLPTLIASDVAWMIKEDWSAYYWGFAFFRNAEWSFPLGNVPNYFFPHGTSVAFTDANPWFSVFFRLFSPLLPADFQFSGFWFLLCYLLQAWFGAKLTGLYTKDRACRALGGALFALTPILPARTVHIALCGLFFLTAALGLYLRGARDTGEARRSVTVSLVLLAWAAGTHGYLSVMLLSLCFALYARLVLVDRALSSAWGIGSAVAGILCTLCVYYLFGYIGFQEADLGAEGFGQFSGDLTAFFNPQGWSRFLPTLKHSPRQWEGFSYLGLGVLCLLLPSFALIAASPSTLRRRLYRVWPLLLVVLSMQLYAYSSRVAYLGKVVWNLEDLYAGLTPLTTVLRSSGRFSWPLHLLLVATCVICTVRLRRVWLSRTLLASALVLQAVDLDPAKLDFSAQPMQPLRASAWQTLGSDYQHLELFPLQLLWVCRYDRRTVDRLSQFAYLRRLTMNSGNFMRKVRHPKRLCERRLEHPLDPKTVYVARRDRLQEFLDHGAVCGQLDGFHICVDGARQTPFAQALQQSARRAR